MLFDIELTATAWKKLTEARSYQQGRTFTAWERLVHHLRRRGLPDLDEGLLRVVALYGEDYAKNVPVCNNPASGITADPDSRDPKQRYLLSRIGYALREDNSIPWYVSAWHTSGSTDRHAPDFVTLHRLLEEELAMAERNRDAEEKVHLEQIVRIMKALEAMESPYQNRLDTRSETIRIADDNITQLRAQHPEGLHFVVGDTHGEGETLKALMKKISFDPAKDHVFFVGDYNSGTSPTALLMYISRFYEPDMSKPGFHLIRGNHERELYPLHALENLPDVIVHKSGQLTYYIVHAGMVRGAFDLINRDIAAHSEQRFFAYRLAEDVAGYNGPFRQITWSMNGLYSQHSWSKLWPEADALDQAHACIIHGHTPYAFMWHGDRSSYGSVNLFWVQQRILFSEDLHAFNIDSNVKGRRTGGDPYRGLSCLCLEALDAAAQQNDGRLTVDALQKAENAVFAVPLVYERVFETEGDVGVISRAQIDMKTISLGLDGEPVIAD